MRAAWRIDVARQLEEAAGFLKAGQAMNARAAIGTAIAYLLRAAADGDEDAFGMMCHVRETIDLAEPTQRLEWEVVDPSDRR